MDIMANTGRMSDYFTAADLEAKTGTPQATWRYWAHIGSGPPSFKIGRRRVWRRTVIEEWLAQLENGAA